MDVRRVETREVRDVILNKHYAGRMPSVSYAFGLFDGDDMAGALTIGKPASNNLCVGLAGPKYSPRVYELNRLVARDGLPENSMSFFVGAVLRELKNTDLILVSYADTGMGHHGYVYQATNWWYTGATKARTDKYVPGNKHSRHYTNEYNHLRKVRTSKHRYVFVPNKKLRRVVMADLKYPILPYPKGENDRYSLGDTQRHLVLNTLTGESFYE